MSDRMAFEAGLTKATQQIEQIVTNITEGAFDSSMKNDLEVRKAQSEGELAALPPGNTAIPHSVLAAILESSGPKRRTPPFYGRGVGFWLRE